MKLGVLTVGLDVMTLEEIATWAAGVGCETLEVGCWPREPRRCVASTQLDVTTFTDRHATRIRALLEQMGVSIACLTYCDNHLDHDLTLREMRHRHLYKVIEAAVMLGVTTVCTFIGRDETLCVAENIALAGQVFAPILEYAGSQGVRVCVENCPMSIARRGGLIGNVAHIPIIWDCLFRELPFENFGLNFDPSHLVGLGIDPIRTAGDYVSKILHVHAKDAELLALEPGSQFIADVDDGLPLRYRAPGKGVIDFAAFFQTLEKGGYDGPVCIELEEPDWIDSPDRMKQGFRESLEYLKPLLPVRRTGSDAVLQAPGVVHPQYHEPSQPGDVQPLVARSISPKVVALGP